MARVGLVLDVGHGWLQALNANMRSVCNQGSQQTYKLCIAHKLSLPPFELYVGLDSGSLVVSREVVVIDMSARSLPATHTQTT